MCIAAAIIGAGALGAVGSVIAGGEQASGQRQAANTQKDMFNRIDSENQGYMKSGNDANDNLSKLMGLTPGDPASGGPNGYLAQKFDPTQEQLDKYPGYQYALKQGSAAVRNADTPGEGALGSSTVKDLMNFNQGMASQNYGTYFNQFQTQQNNIFNRLNSIVGIGQSAASRTANSGTQLGQGIAQAQAGAAGSQAGGIVGATNALSGGASNLAGMMYANAGGSNPQGYMGDIHNPDGSTTVNGYNEQAPIIQTDAAIGSISGGPR